VILCVGGVKPSAVNFQAQFHKEKRSKLRITEERIDSRRKGRFKEISARQKILIHRRGAENAEKKLLKQEFKKPLRPAAPLC
jgi:hypothetical protein